MKISKILADLPGKFALGVKIVKISKALQINKASLKSLFLLKSLAPNATTMSFTSYELLFVANLEMC